MMLAFQNRMFIQFGNFPKGKIIYGTIWVQSILHWLDSEVDCTS